MTTFSDVVVDNLTVNGSITGGVPGPGNVYYADAVNGSDTSSEHDGTTWTKAFATISEALSRCVDGDTVIANGKFREEIVNAQGVGGIRLIGAGTLPRHMDSPWPSGGCAIMPPASPTAATALLEIRGQGWIVENIMFDCPVDYYGIKLMRTAEGANEYDASHTLVRNCRFVSGLGGIADSGGCNHVHIKNNQFHLLTDGTGKAIGSVAGAGIGTLQHWVIEGNRFLDNDNHIVMGLNKGVIKDNIFGAATGKAIDLTGGTAGNIVTGNYLSGTYDSNLYVVAGAGDEWGGNYNVLAGGVTAADPA